MNSAEHVFRLDSGSLALDFLNTGEPRDVLAAPADLLAFLDAAGLGGGAGPGDRSHWHLPDSRILLDEARRLRRDLSVLFAALASGGRVPRYLVYALNRVLAAGPSTASLEVDARGPRLVRSHSGAGPLGALAPIALDAAALAAEGNAGRVRRCDADGCGRWFLDTSKGGRRRWCSMSRCGNRAKAARHRERAASSS